MTLFIVDANVLIDFLTADLEVLKLASVHLGQIYVAADVVDEVKGLTDKQCAAHGIQVVHASLAQSREAAAHADGLSFQDRICLVLARDAGWTCITNDGALRKACDDAGVNVVWGLELMLRVVAIGGMTKQRAHAAARAIHTANPLHVTAKVVAAFEVRLDGIARQKK